MPTYELTSPDGKKYRITAPEGATKEQAYSMLQRQLGNQKAVEGIGNVGIGHAMDTLGGAIYQAGGDVTDVASRMGASPEVAGGAGMLANLALQGMTAGVGMGAGKTAAPIFDRTGKWLMGSALKPSYDQWKSGEAKTAIQALLDKGINATQGGVTKLKDNIGALDDQIKNAISNSTETVSKYDVGSRLQSVFDKFKNQANPQADLNAVKNSLESFNDHPDLIGKSDIPVQLAQKLKSGTYKQLQGKYGELGSADIEAQKGLARGLKETIAEKVPTVAPLLEDQSKLIAALNVAERRSLMDLNKNPAGLSLLAKNPAAAASFMADKSAAFKSLLARMLYSGQDVIPGTAGSLAGGVIGGVLAQPPHGVLSMEPY